MVDCLKPGPGGSKLCLRHLGWTRLPHGCSCTQQLGKCFDPPASCLTQACGHRLTSAYRQFVSSTPFLGGQPCPETSYPTTATVPSFFSKSSDFSQVTATLAYGALSCHCGHWSSVGLIGAGI